MTQTKMILASLITVASLNIKAETMSKKALRYNFSTSDKNSLLTQQGSIELK